MFYNDLHMGRKILTNKFFILFLLIGLFIVFSSIEGSTFFDRNKKQNIESNNTDKKAKEETNDKEEIVEEETVIESPTPTPEVIADIPKNNIDFLIYPNATIVTKTDNSLTLESEKNADEITDWYKGKIDEYDMNITSTIKTNTNGNVLNKISASNGSLKIEIEISASNSSNLVKIIAKLL